MKLELVFNLIWFLSVASSSNKLAVEYYVNLINEQTARAFTYPLPQDSSAFSPSSDSVSNYGRFDYIIVGAGSAGAVIATRLSEIKDNQVLLLEAGGHENDFSDIPAMKSALQGLEFNWNYNSTPQTTACLGMIKQECAYPRGKGLGGSSIINGMVYSRGNRRDYDSWCDAGNPGWSYEDVLPFFIKSEDSHIDGDEGYHGKGGYLNVEYPKSYSPVSDAFIEANLELGRNVLDYNGKEQLGVGRTQFNTISGRRDSTGKAFLLRAKDRPNLTILHHSLVTKILITPVTKQAYGVKFSHDGKLLKAKASKEIIISAGSIGSPQLLMLSGIGPCHHLLHHKIPVIKSLPVGDNLQDHATYFALNFRTNYTAPIESLKQSVEEYLERRGPLTIPSNSEGLGFFQTSMSKTPGVPDIEIASSNGVNKFAQEVYHYTDKTYNATVGKDELSFSMSLILLRPKSRGTLRLKSKSPYDYPLIDPRFLSDPQGHDIETMYQGIQLALEIVDTKAFKKLNASLIYAPLPACQQHEYLSKEYWYCQLRQLTTDVYHPSGTCKMGPNPLHGAVVNHELKVHGIQNLRVADASIMPDVISGHTNAPAIMIGEKVSDMIRKDKN